jgi:hypothetical protein
MTLYFAASSSSSRNSLTSHFRAFAMRSIVSSVGLFTPLRMRLSCGRTMPISSARACMDMPRSVLNRLAFSMNRFIAVDFLMVALDCQSVRTYFATPVRADKSSRLGRMTGEEYWCTKNSAASRARFSRSAERVSSMILPSVQVFSQSSFIWVQSSSAAFTASSSSTSLMYEPRALCMRFISWANSGAGTTSLAPLNSS